jgi:L-methionine (R)-S-oxide reductase
MPEPFDEALHDIEVVISQEGQAREKLQRAMEIIRRADALHSWVGIYYLRGNTLELGPYSGLPTVHTRIPVGSGVCGTAVQERRNQVVGDVRQCDNYLCCSEAVRSEIVVLIWRDHEILGVIDIDSDEIEAFGRKHEQNLEQIAKVIAPVVFEAL